MAKRQTNRLKYNAQLLRITKVKNPETYRVEKANEFVRVLKYSIMGVTATDKFTSRDTNEIVKKIEVRIDRALEDNQKDFRVQIGERIYQIERIFTNEARGMMEVSLAYDN